MNVVSFDPYADIVQDALTSRSSQGRGSLAVTPARLPDPASIPPRQWMYGRILIKGYITVLVAPGGVGKTAFSVAAAISLASGKGRIGDWVYQRAPVIICTLEDPEDELDRRIAAAQIRHMVGRDELNGYLHVVSGRDRPMLMAAIDTDGFTVCYPDKAEMIAAAKRIAAGVIIVDPFVNSHELDENNNPHINAAARAWAEVANEAGCAVLLVHHTRKGAVAGDAEGSRGAGALIAACRVALTLTAMEAKEAEGYGIPEKERRLHIRMDDAKANLAPPSDKARWFRLASIALNNGIPDTPWHHGDHVQAVETWEPPSTFGHHPAPALNGVLDAIAEGAGQGQLYNTRRSGNGGGQRWCGQVLVRMLDIEEGPAAKMVKAWLEQGLLVEQDYNDPVIRKPRKGVFVIDDKRPQ